MKTIVFLYVLIINLYAWGLMVSDKLLAQQNLQRISEKKLFIAAWLGGAVGAFIGMRMARHKTSRWYFMWGIPLCILVSSLWLYPLIVYYPNEWVVKIVSFFS